LDRRHFIIKSGRTAAGLVLGVTPASRAFPSLLTSASASTVLHNGIVLPDPFPPTLTTFERSTTPPYYLASPPEVIPVNVGRQLFVDDFLVASVDGLSLTYHTASVDPEPLSEPKPDEFYTFIRSNGLTVVSYFAAPYSDGVWWDAYRQRFRVWILTANNALRLMESDDGIDWERATLANGSEILMEVPPGRDSGSVWVDYETDDDSARYKMSYFSFQDKKNWIYTSCDGLDWPSFWDPAARTAHYSSNPDTPTGDRTTFFRDPFRKKWVWSLRDIVDLRTSGGREYNRVRRFAETDDLVAHGDATAGNTPWLIADDSDSSEGYAQLYNLDGLAYESLMVFFLTINAGNDTTDLDAGTSIPKPNTVHLGFSRDGFFMTRPSRERHTPLIGPGEPDSWNEGNVQSVGGGMIIDGPPDDEHLKIYFTARENRIDSQDQLVRWGRMGRARIRRDGFASYDADAEGGTLLTRPIRFDHDDGYLFVNVACPDGQLRAEVVTQQGESVPGLSLSDCTPVTIDSTRAMVTWGSTRSLRPMSGTPLRLRFSISSGRLFSFWISPTVNGESNGFLAAGGPNYVGYVDDALPSSTGAAGEDIQPTHFGLISNAPNPFHVSTRIRYSLARPDCVEMDVIDLTGRRVASLVSGHRSAGHYEVEFNASGLASGLYICRLTASGRQAILKMTKL
jgi:hypothetical protein